MHAHKDLEELSERLEQLPVYCDAMTIRELDGFLTGVALCPEFIPRNDWLPVVWGDSDQRAFQNPDQAAATVDVVTAHYSRIVLSLESEFGQYEAVFGDDPDSGEILWEAWIDGLDAAMQLRQASWERLLESGGNEVVAALETLLSLYMISIGESSLSEADIKRMSDKAPDLIPRLVTTLNKASRTMAFGRLVLDKAARVA